MVSNILRLNKLENQEITPNAAPYDLTRQLCDCALAHEARWEAKHIDFDAQLEERVMVLADETMMEIVFNNLISNAIKFTEPGGRIVLRQMKDGDDVVVTVADTDAAWTKRRSRTSLTSFIRAIPPTAGMATASALRWCAACWKSPAAPSA